MVTKHGEQKSLYDDLHSRKFLQLLFSLRSKERFPKWTLEIEEINQLIVPDSMVKSRSLPRKKSPGERASSKRNSLKTSLRNIERASGSISILQFLGRLYELYSICGRIEKERKLNQSITLKETRQLNSMMTYIEDLANRVDGYLHKNPRTKRGYNILYGKDYAMTRKCTPISETAYMTSIVTYIEPPDKSVTDVNTISSVKQEKLWKESVVNKVQRKIELRLKNRQMSKQSGCTDPIVDENLEKKSVRMVFACKDRPEEQKSDYQKKDIQIDDNVDHIPRTR
jgi:hypothetical protein